MQVRVAPRAPPTGVGDLLRVDLLAPPTVWVDPHVADARLRVSHHVHRARRRSPPEVGTLLDAAQHVVRPASAALAQWSEVGSGNELEPVVSKRRDRDPSQVPPARAAHPNRWIAPEDVLLRHEPIIEKQSRCELAGLPGLVVGRRHQLVEHSARSSRSPFENGSGLARQPSPRRLFEPDAARAETHAHRAAPDRNPPLSIDPKLRFSSAFGVDPRRTSALGIGGAPR